MMQFSRLQNKNAIMPYNIIKTKLIQICKLLLFFFIINLIKIMIPTTQTLEVRSNIYPHLLKSLEQSSHFQDLNQSLQTKSGKKSQEVLLKRRKQKQFVSYFHLVHPQPFHHVHKLFNIFGINQTALENQDFQQSFFRTIFYHNFVYKVQKYKNAVVMSLSAFEKQLTQPSTQYLIERLKSQGNQTSYKIACQIQQIRAAMLKIKSQNKPVILQQDNQSITKCLNEFAGQMFLYKFKSQKIALSNELLKFMGYDPQEFAVETTKYKSVFVDFLSSNSYHKIITQALKIIRMFLTIDLSKCTPQEFIANTKMEFMDHIYSKDYKKSFCLLQYFVTPKRAVCIRVKKILNQVNQLQWKPLGGSKKGYDNQKKNWNQKQNRIYNKLGVIASNCLQEEQNKVANYKTIYKKSLDKSQNKINT